MATLTSIEWLQTLADTTRVRLLLLLAGQELSVSELCAVVQLPQSTVSRHLGLLAADGWVSSRKDGTNHHYRSNSKDWDASRQGLWDWVRQQADSPSILLDQQRLDGVLQARSRSEAFFSSTAAKWDHLRVELFGQQLDAFTLAATLPGDAVVGELGCGSAPLCQLISPFVRQAVAIDNSEPMLAAARHRLSGLDNVRLEQAALTALPLDGASLDAAWLVLVLPYIDVPVDVLCEARRVLKPGAPLVTIDLLPHDRTAYRQEMGHVRLGTDPDEFQAWLKEAGLKLRRYHALPPDPTAKGPALFAAVSHY